MGLSYDLTLSHLVAILCVSVVQASVSTLCSIVVAAILVHYGCIYRYIHSAMAVIAPFCAVMPSWLAVVSIRKVYGCEGLSAIIMAHMLLNIPLCWYVLAQAYHTFDEQLYLTARALGATFWQAYRTIIIPQLRSSVTSLATLVFILCFSSTTIPKFAATAYYHHTISSALSLLCDMQNDAIFIAAWFIRMLCIVCLLYVCGVKRKDVPRAHYYDTHSLPAYALHYTSGLYMALVSGIVFLGMPLCALLMLCLMYIPQACMSIWRDLLMLDVVYNSLAVAVTSSFFALMIAGGAIMITYLCSSRIRVIIELLTLLPFVAGSVAIGVLCKMVSVDAGYSAFAALVASHAMLNYPLVYACIRSYTHCFSREWIYQARSMGASTSDIARTLFMPYVYSACSRAWVLASCMSLTEVGAAHALHNKGCTTLALMMRAYRAHHNMSGIMQLSVLVLACTLLMPCIPALASITLQLLMQAYAQGRRLLPSPFQILYRFRQGV